MVPCGLAVDGGLSSKVRALLWGLHTRLWTTGVGWGGYCLLTGHAISRGWVVETEIKSKCPWEQDHCSLSVILGVLPAQMPALCLQDGAFPWEAIT